MDLTIPYVILTIVSPFAFFYYLMRSVYDAVRQGTRDEGQGERDAKLKFTGNMKAACAWMAIFLVCAALTAAVMIVELL